MQREDACNFDESNPRKKKFGQPVSEEEEEEEEEEERDVITV